MPQKKNPDALELLRGKTGRTCGQVRSHPHGRETEMLMQPLLYSSLDS